MAIYFLRHGESESNVAKIFAGQREDSPLTELGEQQAHLAGIELATVGIDHIIASTLQRARQTAEIVGDEIGIESIKHDERLLEYDTGALTGTPLRAVTSHELVSAAGAEDPVAFQNRVLSLLREIKDSTETILLVSHAGVGRTIEAARLGIAPELFYDLPAYPNAHAVELDLGWLV